MELLVRGMTWESDGVLSLDLADPGGAVLPPWEPGAHLDLDGPAGVPRRQYSLCGDPSDRYRYQIAVLREPASRGGSAWVHTVLRPGDRVTVSPPRNNFRLVAAREYLFVAGGIGITPILPMITAARARGADWRLVYGGRRRASMAFTARLDDPRVDLWPQDERGLIDLDTVLGSRPAAVVYCCGPEPLLAAVEARCARRELHVERFRARPRTEQELVVRQADAPFEVSLARSGRTVTVGAGQTIIEACEAAEVYPPSSCLEGTCGTCETKVLAGVPEHRDEILDDEDRAAGETMMICVGRARTPRLVLDL